jgi:hypothetical protein
MIVCFCAGAWVAAPAAVAYNLRVIQKIVEMTGNLEWGVVDSPDTGMEESE